MDPDKLLTSRRGLAGVAAGLAAVAATPALADQKASDTPTVPARPLTDPAKEYSGPPFLPQSQPWPGLQKNMSPKPDSGEKSYVGTGRLAGRKALITGGDSGIGRAVAIAYAREGADVAFGYLPAEEPDAKEVVQLIQQAGRKAVPLPGDIRDEAFCQKLVADAVSGLGGLDIMVSNAARQKTAPSILDISTADFDWTMKTNVYAMYWIVKAAIPHMPPGAAIVCTTSVNAYDPEANLLDYAMTKGAIMIFVKSLAKPDDRQGHPRQRRGARAVLDPVADLGRRSAAEGCDVWQQRADGPPRRASRAGADLRAACLVRSQLHHRPDLWRYGRDREPMKNRADKPIYNLS